MANMSFISCATTCARRLLVSARKGLLAAPSATRDGASYPQYGFQVGAILGFTSRITQRLIGRAIERAAVVGVLTSFSPYCGHRHVDYRNPCMARLHRSDFVAPHATVLSLNLHQSGTPSMMEAKARSVGMMRDSVNPASVYKLRNSASERWRPPVHTNILTSFAAAPRLASD